jgi:hypothetical protein
VRAFRPPLPPDPYGLVSPIDGFSSVRTVARQVLRDAVARARSVAPGIEVTTRLRAATAARALLSEARDARLLVLGSRGRSGWCGLLSGSIAGRVATRFPCPVVVIRPVLAGPVDRPSAWSAPRVVVGVDPTSSGAAIGFAFHAACQRGIPLIALSALTPGAAGDIKTIPGTPPASEAAAGRALEQALARWREQFPTVPVIAKLVCADPAHALIAESPGAASWLSDRAAASTFGDIRPTQSAKTCCATPAARSPSSVVRTAAGRTTAARTGAQRGPVWEPRSTDRTRRQPFWIRRASR